uniref:Telomerase reverse transcriptase n=1 Tax=Trypanosoma congolense (strain IL3000) TaxID=1068625 RepID=G0V1S4_TRYCI|nr:unnamed protein product [Trypanosoma congolense IL3000]
MSSALPAVPGFDGPWSLRDFLSKFFGLRLRYDASQVRKAVRPSSNDVIVPPTGRFFVVMYISKRAPVAPKCEAVRPDAVSDAASGGACRPPEQTHECLQGRPLTSAVLSHPFWDSLFSQVGVTVTDFIALWVPVVVHFESSRGGLQVLGPPLAENLTRADKRRHGVSSPEEQRKTQRVEAMAQQDWPSTSFHDRFSASLYRVDVTRQQLMEETPQRSTADARYDLGPMLRRLWEAHHKSVNSCISTNESTKEQCSVALGSATSCCSDSCMALIEAKNMVNVVFSYSLLPAQEEAVGSGKLLRVHLTQILHCVLGSVCRMNIRGAAIKHTNFLEKRCSALCPPPGDQTAGNVDGMKAGSVCGLVAPESVVTSYLRTLFDGMWWRDPSIHLNATVGKRVKFWGEEDSVLTKLCGITADWLRCGRRVVFPLKHFLHGILVSRIPWLRGFYTKASGRKRRSTIQQRVYLQLVLFLYQHIVPFLIRRSFHVTYSSKGPSAPLFVPKCVWARIVRRELQRVSVRRAKRTHTESLTGSGEEVQRDVLPPMALERLTSDGLRKLANSHPQSTIVGDTPQRSHLPLFFSDVRFLIHGLKLRPIARVRTSHLRPLLKIADGVRLPVAQTNPPSLEARKAADPSGTWPPSGSASLRDCLRCLDAGVEERRVLEGVVQRTNLSHNDEYAEIRSFVESTRRFLSSTASVSDCSPPSLEGIATVTMVRGDAMRCYNYLPQEVVVDSMKALVNHEVYYSVTLTVVSPSFSSDYNADGHGDAAVEGGPGLKSGRLHVSERVVVISDKCMKDGVFFGIPEGSIVYEENTGDSSSIISGENIRSLLQQHLRSHLVLVDGKLYVQRVGITQGSAVAMLLCDRVLEKVDESLSDILSRYEEPALLLRRVDDVLVVTLSPVAAQTCEEALQRGWPEVGFFCQREKMQCSVSTQPVRWCGLLWDPKSLEFSVEWSRLAQIMPHITVYPRTGGEPLHSSKRFLRILGFRTPLTVFCMRINSKARVVQTLYEISLLWARFFLDKISANIQFIRPHVQTIFRPLNVAVGMLRHLLKRQDYQLRRMGSLCDITHIEVRLCVYVALCRTFQRRLPLMIDLVRATGKAKRGFFIKCSARLQRRMKALLTEEEKDGQTQMSSPTAAELLLDEGEDGITSKGFSAVRFTRTTSG